MRVAGVQQAGGVVGRALATGIPGAALLPRANLSDTSPKTLPRTPASDPHETRTFPLSSAPPARYDFVGSLTIE
jgi:hypothetical protein